MFQVKRQRKFLVTLRILVPLFKLVILSITIQLGIPEDAVELPRYLTVVERLAPFQIRGTEVGVVLDLMIHDIGIVMALVGSPLKTVDAIGVRVSNTEDIANARLVFESGCVANLNASRVSEKKAREIGYFKKVDTFHWIL